MDKATSDAKASPLIRTKWNKHTVEVRVDLITEKRTNGNTTHLMWQPQENC